MAQASAHPYRNLPEHTRWRKAITLTAPAQVDPVVGFPFQITADQKVATAGSCFAQHIARHLRLNNFNYFVAETAHPLLGFGEDTTARFNYGTFSARYGNIYTSRQLVQLAKRALGQFTPVEDAWLADDGRWVDPFRPQIQPNGFASLDELHLDRRQHLARVAAMFRDLDYFVFTLGLTELWYCREDGAALPICPGVSGGVFDEGRYGFTNLTANQVVADMNEFLDLLRTMNPRARVILTVSPVPLAATALQEHVLVSTTYSKAVLRVAAEQLRQEHEDVAYFPSYEIITGNFNRGAYYDEGLRDVTEEGVNHVMGLFLRHATKGGEERAPAPPDADARTVEHYKRLKQVVETICEEAAIEASMAQPADTGAASLSVSAAS